MMKNTKKNIIFIIIAILASMPVIGAILITIAAVREWGFVGFIGKVNLFKVFLLWNDYSIARIGFLMMIISGIILVVIKFFTND